MRLLLLGGTSEARELAAHLVEAGVDVTTSLAGRVTQPLLPVGKVRIGGFGGVAGLRATLGDFDAVVAVTHPFARGMTRKCSRGVHPPPAAPAPDRASPPSVALVTSRWPTPAASRATTPPRATPAVSVPVSSPQVRWWARDTSVAVPPTSWA